MNFTSSQNHPLIENENTYLYIKKYVSIHSEDRNVHKYPNASEFDIELPQDYTNVSAVRLSSWSFPTNLNVFTVSKANTTFTFQFVNIYNPADHGGGVTVDYAIYDGLSANINTEYIATIEPGIYTPEQMAIELTNRLNTAVTNVLDEFFNNNSTTYAAIIPTFSSTGYTQFVVAYNAVEQNMWFGNKSSQFAITNESQYYTHQQLDRLCLNRNELPDNTNWGLPPYLGFDRKTTIATYSTNPDADVNATVKDGIVVPIFSYLTPPTGLWLLPSLPGAIVYYLHTPFTICPVGPQYIYMEIAGLNCLDETSPFNTSEFTSTTNQTNGTVNSAFAKIPISTTTSIPQRWGLESMPYKWFFPPNERIRKLKIKMRYHNGQIVDFGDANYSFMIEFTILGPQNNRIIKSVPSVL